MSSEDADRARRYVRRAAEAQTETERNELLHRAQRLVGRAEMRKLARRYNIELTDD